MAHANGDRDRVIELALAAVEGGELIAADGGFLPIYAVMALMIADRDEALDVCEQMLAAAHRNGSMFGITAIRLWRGLRALSPRRPRRRPSTRCATRS